MGTFKKKVRLALKNPELAWHKARITLRNEVTGKWDYYLRSGKASPPKVISIRMSNACNMKCKMCGQPRMDDTSVPRDFFTNHLKIEQWKDLIDQVARNRPNLYLWGGEPFIYGRVLELVRYAKDKKLTCQINTNGLLLKKRAEEVVDSGLDDLIVSIDGPAEVHDEIRGIRGAFDKIREGILLIQEIKKSRGTRKPIVRVRGTVNPYNFEHLFSLVDISKDFGADSLNFNHFWFTSQEQGEKYQRVMKDLFDCEATSWRGFVFNPDGLDTDSLRKELGKFEQNNVDFPITLSPYVRGSELERYYKDLSHTFGSDRCYAIWFKTYLMPNGDVTPCPDFPDYMAGNITEEKFMDIWNGPRYVKFRTEVKKHRLLPICARCCDLYVSNINFL